MDGQFSTIRKLGRNFRLDRDSDIPKLNLKLLRQFWELTIPFWRRPGAWRSYLILALYAAFTFGGSLFTAYTAKLTGDKLNALSKHDAGIFYALALAFFIAQLGYSLVSIIASLPYNILLKRWQEWLTKLFVTEYLHGANYYLLNRNRVIDNPDERISNDIAQFVTFPASAIRMVALCTTHI